MISATNQRFARQQLSSACAETIREQIQTRRDALLDAATNRRLDVVRQAQAERAAAIREAEGLRPTPTAGAP